MSIDKVIKGDLTNKYYSQFKIAIDILDGIEKEKKRKPNKCNWYNKEDIAFYRGQLNLVDRTRLLDRLCKNRICSECGDLKINPRSWVVLRENEENYLKEIKDIKYPRKRKIINIICRSCYWKDHVDSGNMRNYGFRLNISNIKIEEFGELFGEVEERFGVYGYRIAQLREKLGISQRKFTKLCKLNKSYYFSLENGKFKTVSLSTAEVIMENIMKIISNEWDEPKDIVFYRSNIKLPEIKIILNSLCKNRVCKLCGELRISLKSWAINKNKTEIICKDCYFKNYISVKIEDYKLFGEVEFRFKVHGYRIAQLREKLEISQREFARQCGWSQSYHFSLENGKFKTVSQNVAETIIEVFGRHGIVCKDIL